MDTGISSLFELCAFCTLKILETAFFVFERTKHQRRRHLRNYLILQSLCSEAAPSPGINAFWY